MIPLYWYLVFSIALFCIGLFGVLARKNAVAMLMGIELMLNAVNINLIAFWRYFFAGATQTDTTRALAFVAIVFVAAAAEAAVGLALIISVYRRRQTIIPEDMNILKG